MIILTVYCVCMYLPYSISRLPRHIYTHRSGSLNSKLTKQWQMWKITFPSASNHPFCIRRSDKSPGFATGRPDRLWAVGIWSFFWENVRKWTEFVLNILNVVFSKDSKWKWLTYFSWCVYFTAGSLLEPFSKWGFEFGVVLPLRNNYLLSKENI